MTGSVISHYRLSQLLGEGGMGSVYKAVDQRLDRTVALKVIKAQFTLRFEQEARAISALNHPNIATLYDVGEHEGQPYLVMEFVDGAPLKGPLPVDKAVQAAGALAAAHAARIIHRDLKPGNILLTSGGRIKLLDFGLAKRTFEPGPEDATQTLAAGVSQEGSITGTVAYMSPEQAEGRALDARSDIFSFGVVLYELLTGNRAFAGPSPVSTLSKILHEEPKPLPLDKVPREVERIVSRCLRKDPDRRFQSAADLRVVLEDTLDAVRKGGPPEAAVVRRGMPAGLVAALAIGALALGAGAMWWLRPPVVIEPMSVRQLTRDEGIARDPAISPDGKLVVYASDRSGDGNLDLWLQQVAGGEAIRLTHTPLNEREPSFSPDGSQIVYRTITPYDGIYVISTLGGESRKIGPGGLKPRFSPDGKWIAARGGALTIPAMIIPVQGGTPRSLRLTGEGPVWFPDSQHLLLATQSQGVGTELTSVNFKWMVSDLEGKQLRDTGLRDDVQKLGIATSSPITVDGQEWIFSGTRNQITNLYSLRVGSDLHLRGVPRRLTYGPGADVNPSISANGRIAYSVETSSWDFWKLPLDAKSGRGTAPPKIVRRGYSIDSYPALSPDGTLLAFSSAPNRSDPYTLLVRDLSTGKDTPLVTEGGAANTLFSSDGKELIYQREQENGIQVFRTPVAGGDRTLLFQCPGNCDIWDWHGDLVFYEQALGGAKSLYVRELAAGRMTQIVTGKSNFYEPRLSPDGRLLLYTEAVGSINRIHLANFKIGQPPKVQDLWQSTQFNFAGKTRWSPDGRFFYFYAIRDGRNMLRGQQVNPDNGSLVGESFELLDFPDTRRSPFNIGIAGYYLAIGPGEIIFNQGDVSSNIWLAEPPASAAH